MAAQDLLSACQQLAQRGWVANHDGNISLRRPGGRFLVTPTAFRKADVRGVDLLVIELDGTVQQGRHRVFSEWQLHRAVFEARPDMGAVIHAHPPAATAMACAGQRLDPGFMAESLVSIGDEIAFVPFFAPGDGALSEAVNQAALRSNAALLGSHGVLTWGSDITMALARMELVEQLATVFTAAASLGGVKPLPPEVRRAMVAKHHKAGLAAPGAKR